MFLKTVLISTFLFFTCVSLSSSAPANNATGKAISSGSSSNKNTKYPDFLSKCKRNDPKLNDCIIRLINDLRPQLAKGIPRLRVPALEPLLISRLIINRNTDTFKMKAKAENVTIWGGSDFIINSLEVDPDKLRLKMALTLPQLHGEFKADFDGRVLSFPIKGKGKFSGNITNVRCTVDGNGTLVKEKGGEFLQLKDIKLKATPGDLTGIKFKSSSNSRQDEALINTAREFFKQNRNQVNKIVIPIAEETAVEVLGQFVNAILKTVPFDEILRSTA